MLRRVAEAMRQKLTMVMTAQDPQVAELGYAFVLFVRMLRRRHGLTVDKLAAGSQIDRDEIVAMERNNRYRPTGLTLHRLSQFYDIPQRRLMALAGAVKNEATTEHASRFAAQSESFVKLTREEKKAVDDFVRFLKTGH
jgi:transcriptional regulator with XRE-family HTH domain